MGQYDEKTYNNTHGKITWMLEIGFYFWRQVDKGFRKYVYVNYYTWLKHTVIPWISKNQFRNTFILTSHNYSMTSVVWFFMISALLMFYEVFSWTKLCESKQG